MELVQRIRQKTRSQRQVDGNPLPPLQDRCRLPRAHQAGEQAGMRQQQPDRPQRQVKQHPERIGTVAVAVARRFVDGDGDCPDRQRQQGEQFRVVDAPNLPDSPVFPNRLLFAGGGFAGGLVLGLLLTGWFEFRDTSLRSERDVWAFTKLSTLAVISHIDGMPQPEPEPSRWKLFTRFNKPTENPLG